jgi:two-component system chemotaxis response regulator CheB
LIVDDSRIYRAAIETALRGADGVAVIGSVFSGAKALEFMRERVPDFVTLDVEMPGLSGLETLKAIQQLNGSRPPGTETGVIMVSAFTKRGADVTMQALQAGALDFVTKPSGATADENIERLRQELVPRIRLFLARRHRTRPVEESSAPADSRPESIAPTRRLDSLRRPVRVVLIGASTGGPKALASLLPDLVARMDAPILVVQHMPAPFTRSLADQLARHVRCPVVQVEHGQPLAPRSVYIARGGQHLVLRRDEQGRLIAGLSDLPPESGCRPSANVLFRSAAEVVGRDSVAILLTGMGNDGTAGLAALHRAGGYVIAQDEESSVVWGMPGSAVAAGVVDIVCPLREIATAAAAIGEFRGTR